ncbi:phenylacetate--CoA ligase family protein [Nitrospira sp. KM1]|uniref:phenylacetate--CoA ligase family protein n=1 Tax=Nitrospira sp. KM1 TaxID=1936990 RepID=UPI0015630643|nr:phenylacetate--CoA ligase family protein [Nitrospira sp. KM1]
MKRHLSSGKGSPYWAERFVRYHVRPDGDNPFDELKKLPILTKGDVQQDSDRIRNPTINKDDLVSCHTSGTTGAGLVFSETAAAERERWALWWRYRQWHGVSHNTWCGYFGGRSVVPLLQTTAPFWRMNYPGRQILFSGYHLSAETAPVYLDALDRLAPPWLHGYPSVLSLIAGYLQDRGRRLSKGPRVVTAGAENLLPQQKQLIEEAFGCPVRQHYGQAEAVANISECVNGHLHVDEDYSFVEFVPLEHHANVFRIVGTNWSNPAFPLFRYDTGDLVELCTPQLKCHVPGRTVGSIDGRREDYVTLPNGARIGRLDHIFKDLTHVREAQIYQPDRRALVFRIVKRDGYDANSERQLLHEARKRLGHDIGITLEYVNALQRSTTGKLRFVISGV